MKLLQTSNMDIVNYCRQVFYFDLPSVTLARRTEKFMSRRSQCDNDIIKYVTSI